MILNYQYRCYPQANQKLLLNQWLRICRYWYNYQLGDRFRWWQENRESYLIPSGDFCTISCSVKPNALRENPSYYSQKRLLPRLKKDLTTVKSSGELLDLTKVPSQTLQDVSKRAQLAFKRFIQGDKNKNRSGKPRFNSASRYRTFKIEGNAVKIERVDHRWR